LPVNCAGLQTSTIRIKLTCKYKLKNLHPQITERLKVTFIISRTMDSQHGKIVCNGSVSFNSNAKVLC
jgi:hypothetical protein